VVITVFRLARWELLDILLHPFDHARVLVAPRLQVCPKRETDSRRRRARAGVSVAVPFVSRVANRVKESPRLSKSGLRNVQAGLLRRQERRHLPTRNGRVAGLTRAVAPAACLMLKTDDEVDCHLRGLAQVLILAQTICLSQGNCSETMGIHATAQ